MQTAKKNIIICYMIKHFYVDFLTIQWFFLNSHYHSLWQWCWHSVAKFPKRLWFQNKVNILCTKKNNSLLNLHYYQLSWIWGRNPERKNSKSYIIILLVYWPRVLSSKKAKEKTRLQKSDIWCYFSAHISQQQLCPRCTFILFKAEKWELFFYTCTLKFSHEKLIYINSN